METEESDILYVCPRCGDITWDDVYDNKCYCCDLDFDKFIKTNYTGEIYNQMDKEQTKQWEQMLRERYVLCPDNPYFDKESYYKREDLDFKSEMENQRFEEKLQTDSQQSHQLICPKCAGTNFTPVPRKWSLLTGFMTNKVDMVCNQCGHVVKK